MNTIYLVRHGENPANLTKELSHREIDYPLTPKGRLQAQQTADYFEGMGIDAIYTSPLKRAVETAAIIDVQLGLGYKVMENFREINVGALERKPASAEVWEQHIRILDDWFSGKHHSRFPDGEDYNTLWDRMRSGVEQVVSGVENHKIIILAHGGLFLLTLKDLCPQVDVDWDMESHNCSISEVQIEQKNGAIEGSLVSWGLHDHLHGEAAKLVPGTPQEDSFA